MEQSKAHPSFRIGLFMPTYVCPTWRTRSAQAVDPDVVTTRKQIGFSQEGELEAARGTPPAKVFCDLLTGKLSLGNLTWDPTDAPRSPRTFC
jgi:hypothetical protein